MVRMLLGSGLVAATLAAGVAFADDTDKPDSIGPLNARDLVNQPVVNFQDRDVANVTTVTDTPDQGRVAVLAVGGVLGFGRKEVAVPISSLQVDDRGRILIDASADDLKARPAFSPTGG